MRGWFVEISLSFSETSTAFRHLLNVLLLSRFNWAIISIFLNELSSWVYQDKFLTETGSLINFPFSQLFDGKLIFSRNPTELAKTQIHVHLLEKISLLETLFSRVNGCCYGYYNQLCVWGIWRSGLRWLAALTVRLQVSNYSWLSDCTVRLQLYRLISAKIKQLKYHKHLRTL